jgi:hypothetical protein
MVETIGPVVGGDTSAIKTRFAHVLGGMLGGMTTGFAAGVAGSVAYTLLGAEPIPHVILMVALPLLVMVLVRDSTKEGATLGLRRQTPQSWRYVLPPVWAASLNGFDLGLGWTTRVYFASTFVAIGTAFAHGDPAAGAIVGGAFGLARSATVTLLTALPMTASAEGTERIIALRPRVRLANALSLAQFLGVVIWTMG